MKEILRVRASIKSVEKKEIIDSLLPVPEELPSSFSKLYKINSGLGMRSSHSDSNVCASFACAKRWRINNRSDYVPNTNPIDINEVQWISGGGLHTEDTQAYKQAIEYSSSLLFKDKTVLDLFGSDGKYFCNHVICCYAMF